MKSRFTLVLLLALMLGGPAPAARAATPPDPVLVSGLRAYENNGLEACLRVWYPDRPALATEMRAKLLAATKDLGDVIDSEVVTIQPISTRVTRYYVAVYFSTRPLWIRIDRYAGRDKAFYTPLKCSVDSDGILPAYLTEFMP